MPDTMKPMSKSWHDRQRRHKHNSFQGHCRMAMMNMQSIMDADTTTPEAKAQAMKVYSSVKALSELVRKRVDK